jgi:molybdate transport system substrate-binding protein
MKASWHVVAAAFGVLMLSAGVATTDAAEIKIISAVPMRQVINELGAPFERSTGHKLTIKYVASPLVEKEIDAGEAFDVAISNPGIVDALIRKGKVAAGTRADIARAGLGVGVRKGAPKPDIGSVEAFKRTLLAANAVSYSGQGASAPYFNGMLERLGIAEQMKQKLRPLPPRLNVEAVAKGDADIVVVVVPSILVGTGVDLVGPLPAELQTWIGFSAGLGAAAKEPTAAKALIGHLTSAAAVPIFKAKGFELAAR